MNRHFSKEEIQMAKKHKKRCQTPLIIREMQLKTTISPHLMQPVRMVIIRQTTNSNYWQGQGEKRTLNDVSISRNVNWCSPMEKSVKFPQKIKNITAQYSNSTSGCFLKENKHTNINSKRYMYTYINCNITYSSQDTAVP